MPTPIARVDRTCRFCGAEFSLPACWAKRGGGVFCSRTCQARHEEAQREQRRCERCGAPFALNPSDARSRAGRFCSRPCWDAARRAETDRRFWSRLTGTDAPDGCWEWSGARNAGGYGVLTNRGGSGLAHRRAWELANGPIPDGLHCLHRCDNPACCNPAHLWLGSQPDNVADMVAKGRHPVARGEAHPRARLSDADVAAIRARHAAGETQTALAAAFGVKQAHVSRLVRRTARS